MLWFTDHRIIGYAVHQIQRDYRQYHREVFEVDGSFNETKWHAWKGPYEQLCNVPLTRHGYTLAVLSLWLGRMLGEFRSLYRLHHVIWTMERSASNEGYTWMNYGKIDVDRDGRDEETDIAALSSTTRIIIYVTIIIPQFFVACFLAYIGCNWLCATESFTDLILNALALVLIIEIDEMLYEEFSPILLTELVSRTKFVIRRSKETNEFRAYIRSIVFLISCFSGAYLYMTQFQTVLPGFGYDIKEHCGMWFTTLHRPLCGWGDENCFPYGMQQEVSVESNGASQESFHEFMRDMELHRGD
mmetsp:Transcript_145179/g.253388  ORF Transcript_145179/g.253388 Transcript_145179/m.253388 type:complete len:301 (+) Transcript_145179:1-903(+)